MMKAHVVLWGSSHFAARHHFSKFFEEEWQQQNLDKFFSPVLDFSVGGKKLDQQTVNRITNWVDSHSGEPQVHIVTLGDNNLREAAKRHCNNPEKQEEGIVLLKTFNNLI